jgi:predicted HNH restriction endonuclease
MAESKDRIECGCGCGKTHNEKDKFGRKRKFIRGHNGRKYPHGDKNAKHKAWVKKNSKQRKLNRRARYRQRKVYLMSLFGCKCEYCGYEYNGDNSAAFDFHHRDPKTKKISVCTALESSLKDLVEECKKCDLICSNCHRILHARE